MNIIEVLKRITRTYIFLSVLIIPLTFSTAVYAQTDSTSLCGLFPCDQYSSDSKNIDVGSLIKFGLSAIFVVIIIIGIFSVIRAALKIIQSEGDPKKLEEGTNILKGVWIGLAVIFAGILGIIIVLLFFNAQEALNPNTNLPPGVLLDPTAVSTPTPITTTKPPSDNSF